MATKTADPVDVVDIDPTPPEVQRKEPANDAPRVVDMSGGDATVMPQVAQWDGTRTRFRLGSGMVRDGKFVHAGQTVEFEASFMTVTNLDGTTEGRWYGPEAGTVAHLLASGWFAGTQAWQQRKTMQGAVDYERGVNRNDGQPAPEGLEERTSEQQEANLADMLRGGLREQKRKEAQESKSASEELAEKLAEVLTPVIAGRR